MIGKIVERVVGKISTASVTDSERYLRQSALQAERDRLIGTIRDAMPENPVLQGRKIYSQTDEDGILQEIFSRIGTRSEVFVEFGCGDGRENNSHALLLSGWKGMWADGSPKNIEAIRSALTYSDTAPSLLLCEAFVTLENIEAIYCSAAKLLPADGQTIDLLSMDLDGNDLHFLSALVAQRPRVICSEYNAILGPDIRASVEYAPDHTWQGEDYMGASLASLCDLLEPAGYRLVCCNLSGANAFFVEEEYAGLFGNYSRGELFQPARYHLIFLDDYHQRTLGFLAAECHYQEIDRNVSQAR